MSVNCFSQGRIERQKRRLTVNDSVDSGIDCKDRKDAWLTKKNHIQPREE